jgi:hypothetical protein
MLKPIVQMKNDAYTRSRCRNTSETISNLSFFNGHLNSYEFSYPKFYVGQTIGRRF